MHKLKILIISILSVMIVSCAKDNTDKQENSDNAAKQNNCITRDCGMTTYEDCDLEHKDWTKEQRRSFLDDGCKGPILGFGENCECVLDLISQEFNYSLFVELGESCDPIENFMNKNINRCE